MKIFCFNHFITILWMEQFVRFKGLDLNLLVAFDILLETRSVSRAAERMNLSQPAMSAALTRLRDYFGNAILVAEGKRLYPTAYAETLLPRVRECLRCVESVISVSKSFDPKTSARVFRLLASDYMTAAVIVPLIRRLAQIGPNIRIEVLLPSDHDQDLIEQSKVDLSLMPEDYVIRGYPTDLLFTERQVLVGWSGNPIFERLITEEDVFAAGHVGVSIGVRRQPAFADRQLQIMGKIRRVEVITESFTMVPWLLKETPRLAIMHERLALTMAQHFPITCVPLPFQISPMREMVQYHQARAADEGLTWLRTQLHAVVSDESIDVANTSP
jgi:DNA-binding transcriptional LysR family regulator